MRDYAFDDIVSFLETDYESVEKEMIDSYSEQVWLQRFEKR